MPKEKDIELLRSKFFKTLAKVPDSLRDEIVAVIGDEPYNWSTANIEIKGKTKKGEQILRLMDEVGLLGD